MKSVASVVPPRVNGRRSDGLTAVVMPETRCFFASLASFARGREIGAEVAHSRHASHAKAESKSPGGLLRRCVPRNERCPGPFTTDDADFLARQSRSQEEPVTPFTTDGTDATDTNEGSVPIRVFSEIRGHSPRIARICADQTGSSAAIRDIRGGLNSDQRTAEHAEYAATACCAISGSIPIRFNRR